MKFTDFNKLTNGRDYYPEFGENQLLPLDERMYFKVQPMTNKIQTKYDAMLRVKMIGKKKDEMKSNGAEVQKAVWLDCVLSMHNVVIEDPTTGAENTNPTPAEAYDALPQELIKEVIEAIENKSKLDSGVKKP